MAESELTIFVLFDGKGEYVHAQELYDAGVDIGDVSSDEQILNGIAEYMNEPNSAFLGYVVDRSVSGMNMTVRPQEKFA